MYILKLDAFLKSAIWGGQKLKTEFGFKTDLSNIAEAWVLSCFGGAESTVLNGEFKGKPLSYALNHFGNSAIGTKHKKGSDFPMLIKIIDAYDNLSIQVHPDDNYANAIEHCYGKNEMWYILNADPGANIYYGFNKDITKQEFEQRIKDGTLPDVLNKVEVKKGECYYIPAGTIHAINKGVLLAEVQQSSNITYRVFDYKRKDKNGNERELHIKKALDVTVLKKQTDKPSTSDILVDCEYFNVKRRRINSPYMLNVNEDSFVAVLCTAGSVTVNDIPLVFGEACFIPACFKEVKIFGNGEIIESRI